MIISRGCFYHYRTNNEKYRELYTAIEIKFYGRFYRDVIDLGIRIRTSMILRYEFSLLAALFHFV